MKIVLFGIACFIVGAMTGIFLLAIVIGGNQKED